MMGNPRYLIDAETWNGAISLLGSYYGHVFDIGDPNAPNRKHVLKEIVEVRAGLKWARAIYPDDLAETNPVCCLCGTPKDGLVTVPVCADCAGRSPLTDDPDERTPEGGKD